MTLLWMLNALATLKCSATCSAALCLHSSYDAEQTAVLAVDCKVLWLFSSLLVSKANVFMWKGKLNHCITLSEYVFLLPPCLCLYLPCFCPDYINSWLPSCISK